MNFKEWFGKGENFYYMESDHRYVSKVSYNAGQRSQQAKIDELQARIDEALIEMKNQLGDEDFCDMQRPDYDAMLYALRNIKDILKGNKDE